MAIIPDAQGYTNAEHVVWAQEEHENMGAWSWLQPRLASIGIHAKVGRTASRKCECVFLTPPVITQRSHISCSTSETLTAFHFCAHLCMQFSGRPAAACPTGRPSVHKAAAEAVIAGPFQF